MIKRLIPLIIALIFGFAAGLSVATPMKPLNEKKQANAEPVKTQPATPKQETQPALSADDLANHSNLQPLMDNFYDALQKENYQLYSKDFIPEMLPMNTKENFEEIVKQGKMFFGKMDKPVFLGSYKKGDNVFGLWKSATEKGNGDALYTLTAIKLNDDWKVVGFSIQ